MPPKLNNSFSADVSGLGMPGSFVDYGSYGPSGDWSTIKTHGTGFMGSWSKEDQALFEVQMAAAQQQNAWSQMEYENWYNSPEQQARRQRLAGLNPDLIGVENTPSASPGNVTPPTGPAGTGVGEFASAVSSVLSVFTTTQSIIAGTQSFKAAKLANQKSSLENLSKIDDLATTFLVDTIPGDFYDADGFLGDNGKNHWHDIEVMADMYSRHNGLSKKERKQFISSVHRQALSPRFNKVAYETRRDVARARTDLAESTASPYYSDSDESMRIALQPFIKAKMDMIKSGFQSGFSQSNYQSDYYKALDGTLQGSSQNDIISDQAQMSRANKALVSARHDSLKALYNSYKSGNIFSGIMLALMDVGSSIVSSFSGSVGFSHKF